MSILKQYLSSYLDFVAAIRDLRWIDGAFKTADGG